MSPIGEMNVKDCVCTRLGIFGRHLRVFLPRLPQRPAGEPPAGDDGEADDRAAEDVVEVRPEIARLPDEPRSMPATTAARDREIAAAAKPSCPNIPASTVDRVPGSARRAREVDGRRRDPRHEGLLEKRRPHHQVGARPRRTAAR